MKEVFSDSEWEIQTYRAWHWDLNDCSRNRKFILYFKVFVLIINKSYLKIESKTNNK